MKNWTLLRMGLIQMYNINCEVGSKLHLSVKQIDGILEYIDTNYDREIDLEKFIDDIIINYYGFSDKGIPFYNEENKQTKI